MSTWHDTHTHTLTFSWVPVNRLLCFLHQTSSLLVIMAGCEDGTPVADPVRLAASRISACSKGQMASSLNPCSSFRVKFYFASYDMIWFVFVLRAYYHYLHGPWSFSWNRIPLELNRARQRKIGWKIGFSEPKLGGGKHQQKSVWGWLSEASAQPKDLVRAWCHEFDRASIAKGVFRCGDLKFTFV